MIIACFNTLKKRIFSYKKSIGEVSYRDIVHVLDVWGKRLLFYCGFYLSMGIFLVLHLLVFMSFAWQQSLPLNAGPNLGYTNYPNNPFHFSSNPNKLSLSLHNGTLETETNYEFNTISQSVNNSYSSNCTCAHGTDWTQARKKCVLVYLNKVILWKPQLVDLKLAFEDYMPVDCSIASAEYNLTASTCSPGLPLSLNNTDGRSFPFTSQPNYERPILAVEIDFSNITKYNISTERDIEMTLQCQLKACTGDIINSIHCPVSLQLPVNINTDS